MLQTIGMEALACLAYGVVAIALMVIGFWFTDLLTPGKLVQQIWAERRLAPAIHVAASLAAVALIVRQAIISSEDGPLLVGLGSAFAYGFVGLVLMVIAFWLIDVVTPGKLGEMVVADGGVHPAMAISAVSHIAVGLIVAASIS